VPSSPFEEILYAPSVPLICQLRTVTAFCGSL